MLDIISHLVGGYLAYWNAGGFAHNMFQFQDYLGARMEVWAYSKVNS